jgi:ABC-type multidrug transport system fused ATPase/permease subunit
LDVRAFKPEAYYPWYMLARNKTLLIVLMVLFSALLFSALLIFSFASVVFALLIATGALTIMGALYYLQTQRQQKRARAKALKQIMTLEKKQFMHHLLPFIAPDLHLLAERITTRVDFTPREYVSVLLSTQCRVANNTDEFIKDIERLFTDPKKPPIELDFVAFSEPTLQVPELAKQKYQTRQNPIAFNESFNIPPDVQAAILAKIKEAMNRAALGRPL